MRSKFYSRYGGDFRSDWKWYFVITSGKYTEVFSYDNYAGRVEYEKGKFIFQRDYPIGDNHREELQKLLIKGIFNWGIK